MARKGKNDLEAETVGGGKSAKSMSVAETNAMRVALGLSPLDEAPSSDDDEPEPVVLGCACLLWVAKT